MSGPVVDQRSVAVSAMMYPREKVEEDVWVVSMSHEKSPAVAGLFRQYWGCGDSVIIIGLFYCRCDHRLLTGDRNGTQLLHQGHLVEYGPCLGA